MPAGRPTKYGPDVIEKTIDYVENFEKYGDRIPMQCGLAKVLGVHKETIQAWLKDENKPEFSVLTRQIASEQERALINNSLAGSFNPAISKLILSKHGYHERSELGLDDMAGLSASERKQRVAALLQKGRDRASSDD